MPIISVTLNPGFDEYIHVDAVRFGGVGNLKGRALVPSGKGVNAARIAAALDPSQEVTAVQPVSATDRELFHHGLVQSRVRPVSVIVSGDLRRNLTVISSTDEFVGAHFKAEGALDLGKAAFDDLFAQLIRIMSAGGILTLSGSVPDSTPVDAWARMARAAVDHGMTVIVDVYGRALPMVGEAVPVWAMTPNDVEISDMVGDSYPGVKERIRAALLKMDAYGVGIPIVTAGQLGTWFLEHGTIHRATIRVDRPKLVVGAGDAFVAGLAVVHVRTPELPPSEVVRFAAAVAGMWIAGTPITELHSSIAAFLDRTQVTEADF